MKKGYLIALWVIVIGGFIGTLIYGEGYVGITLFAILFVSGIAIKIVEWYKEKNKNKIKF